MISVFDPSGIPLRIPVALAATDHATVIQHRQPGYVSATTRLRPWVSNAAYLCRYFVCFSQLLYHLLLYVVILAL